MNRKAKKALKITGITLGSILGLIIIAVLLVCWTVFTPGRLTKVANKAIDKYAPCKVDLERVDLTLVKTYPFLAFRLNGLLVYDEMETSPSDTLLYINEFTVTTNLKALLKEKKIILTNMLLDNVQANMFVDAAGHSNIDFLTSGEKKEKETDDSSDLDIYADLQKITIDDINASYIDLKSGTKANLNNLGINLKGLLNYDSLDANINAKIAGVKASIKNDSTDIDARLNDIKLKGTLAKYKDNVTCGITFDLKNTNASLGEMKAAINDLKLALNNLSCTLGKEGLGNLKTDLNLTVSDIKYANQGMQANTNHFSVKAGQVAFNDNNLDLKGLSIGSRDIDFEMSDTVGSKTSATIDNLQLDVNGNLKTDMSVINTSVNTSINGIGFTIDGESPMAISSPSISLKADALIDKDDIALTPELSTPSINVNIGGDELVPDWSLSLYAPLTTNKSFNRFDVLNGSNLNVNGQKIGFAANGTLGGSSVVKGNASVKASNLDIDKLVSMIPDKYKNVLDGIDVHGILGLDVSVKGAVKQDGMQLDKASANVSLARLDAGLKDSIFANANKLTAKVQYPSLIAVDPNRQTADVYLNADDLKLSLIDSTNIDAALRDFAFSASVVGLTDTITEMSAQADVAFSHLEATMDTISGSLDNTSISATMTPVDGTVAFMARAAFDQLEAAMGQNMGASLSSTSVVAMAQYDQTKDDILLKWNPNIKFTLDEGSLDMLEEPVEIDNLDVDFTLGHFNINDCRVSMGNSDIMFWGDVYNIGAFIEKTGLLTGELFLESDHVDVTQLMGWFSGMGNEETQEAVQEAADKIEEGADTITASPFIVPKGIDLTLYTNLAEIKYNDHLFNNVGGDVTIKDGVAVLQELGFSSDAAEMQLTAIYKTPSPQDDPFIELDFHLLDIDINELISLIPSVDSIVPMLKSFSGHANFHLAAETYLENNMPIMSTLLGAAAIEGKDLVVLDGDVFNGIKRKLLMSKKAENKIDSIDVELQVIRNKVTLYPFRIHMDRYTAIVDGRHFINKDLDCKYTVSLIETPLPIRLGVKVSGSLNEIAASPIKHIRIIRPQYKKLYNPEKRSDTDEMVMGIKDHILETLKGNVR